MKREYRCCFSLIGVVYQLTSRRYYRNCCNRQPICCYSHKGSFVSVAKKNLRVVTPQLVCRTEERPSSQQVSNSNKKYTTKSITKGIAVLLLLLLFLVYVHNNWPILSRLDMKSSLQWIQSLDLPLRFVIFFGVHTIAVVGCFPGTVAIEMAAGLSMNLYYGLASKSILYRWTQKRLEQYPQAKKWMDAIAQQGWKLALFSRLSPIPSFINNYLIALSPISFHDYMIATIVGIIPFLFQVVALGAGIQEMRQQLSWITLSKYIAIILGIIGLGYYTKKMFHSMWEESDHHSQT
ncbi:hypothetical protein Gasu2_25760 [Galdieria sulphuraria]|nr:hypothetical protein Gasu2_25760 [Galdieria sulphuraria]